MSTRTVTAAFVEQLRRRDWITVPEYADGFGISSATAYRHVGAGLVPSFRVGPKLLRIPTAPLRDELGIEDGPGQVEDELGIEDGPQVDDVIPTPVRAELHRAG